MGPPGLVLEEVEPAPLGDAGVIVDGESRGIAEGHRPGQPDHDRVAGPLVRQVARSAGHASHLQPPLHVEDHAVEARPAGDDGRGDPPVEGGRVPVEALHLDALVDQVVVVGRRVAAVDDALEVGLGVGRLAEEGD